MNWLINLACRILGLSSFFSAGALQLLGGVGSILVAAGHLALAVSGSSDPASALAAVKSSASALDILAISNGVALIASHFRHGDTPAAPAPDPNAPKQ